jgi:hypothetical protein
MKAGIGIMPTLVLACLLGVVLPYPEHSEAAEQMIVTARRLEQRPSGPNDPVWNGVPPDWLHVKGRDSFSNEDVKVSMKAAYTPDEIFFLFRWPDPTKSITKKAWRFDGTNWVHLEGDEDRLALIFEITRIEGFATRGCTVICHSPPDVSRKDWKLATHDPAEKADLWHWKAARSNPYHSADDGWLTVAGNPSGSYRTTGRRSDAGEGGDVLNETEDKSGPMYMRYPSMKPLELGFLLYEDAVPISPDAVFSAGDMLTYRMPRKPDQSRADIKATAQYANGEWTLMLSRKLKTGWPDDVQFNIRKDYSFALALFDDSGDDHSKATLAMMLRFAR